MVRLDHLASVFEENAWSMMTIEIGGRHALAKQSHAYARDQAWRFRVSMLRDR